jgi:hypothetical protein
MGITRLSDLLDGPTMRDARDAPIIAHLLKEKVFFCCDRKGEELRPEPVKPALVASFFQKAKGRTIRGFKTGNSLTVDV